MVNQCRIDQPEIHHTYMDLSLRSRLQVDALLELITFPAPPRPQSARQARESLSQTPVPEV
jgi:hypothetical protein